jgi:hypothetical protein
MATDLETTVRNAAQKFAQALADASELTVQTEYVEIGDGGAVDFEQGRRPIGRTVIKLDGDTEMIIPVQRTQAGALERDAALLELHLSNVSSATKYRTDLLEALLSIVRQARSR